MDKELKTKPVICADCGETIPVGETYTILHKQIMCESCFEAWELED